MCSGTKKRHGEPEQLLSTGGATWWLRATAERRGMRGRRQRGSAEAVAGLPGDAWSGAGVGVGLERCGNSDQQRCCCGSRENRGGRKGKNILGSYLQLQELQGLHCKTKLPTILKLK
jgi:hypothetical protein